MKVAIDGTVIVEKDTSTEITTKNNVTIKGPATVHTNEDKEDNDEVVTFVVEVTEGGTVTTEDITIKVLTENVIVDEDGNIYVPKGSEIQVGDTIITGPASVTNDGIEIEEGGMINGNTVPSGTKVNPDGTFDDPSSDDIPYYTYFPLYNILSFRVNGGTAVASIARDYGITIDLSAYTTTREGYNFTGWYSDADLNTPITSVQLVRNTTVYAGWTKIEEVAPTEPVEPDKPLVNPFKDVFASDWYYGDVLYVYEKNLMTGTDLDVFSPAVTTTRGMIVTILYRLEGEPSTAGLDNPFDDLTQSWYVDAAKWAAANGIVTGYGNGKYGPEDPITREQMVTILYRYAQYKSVDVSAGENTNILSYNDALEISEYAIPAMQWACGEGIIGGYNGYLTPTASAPRCQIAAILHRYCELIQAE